MFLCIGDEIILDLNYTKAGKGSWSFRSKFWCYEYYAVKGVV